MTTASKEKFYRRLSYSFGNEDWRVESKALQISANDKVMAITASGDRPLHLLLDECSSLTAVDLNPIQNHLLGLKVAAMRALSYLDYLSFLGATPQNGNQRLAQLEQLLPKMDAATAFYWQKHRLSVARGILYQGAVEKLCRRTSRVLKFFRGGKIDRLFSIGDLDEQRQFVKAEWDTRLWRGTVKMLFNFPVMQFLLADPGISDHLSATMRPGNYLYSRLKYSMQNTLARTNPLLSLILRGYVTKEAFPPYLTEQGIATIRQRLEKLSWHTADAIAFLEKSPPNSYDCFSLSDIASYMDNGSFQRLLRAVIHAARPGARVCVRQFMSERTIEHALEDCFLRNRPLERQLEEEESCFVYRFIVGQIVKNG